MKETAKESEAHLSLQEEEAKKAEQEAAKQEEKRWRHTYSDRPGWSKRCQPALCRSLRCFVRIWVLQVSAR